MFVMTATLEPTETDIAALGDAIAASAATLNGALGRWLELVARFDAAEGWASWGAISCAEWLSWRCGLSPVTAREHVRVARRLSELPLVGAALKRGELSFSKVRALARLERITDEAELLELARHASASQLERFVRITRRVTRAEAAATVAERFVQVEFDDAGAAVIRARIPAEDGALLLRALAHVDAFLDTPDHDPAKAEHGAAAADPPTSAGDRPPTPARWADALAWMADHALGAGAGDDQPARSRPAGDRCEVLVHVDAALLTAPPGREPVGHGDAVAGDQPGRAPLSLDPPHPCHLDDGAPLASETVRRLCCGAGIVPVVRDCDVTLAVGRRTRSIPPAIRRALRVRHPGCSFPGCHRTRWLDAHHVVHWAHGGSTDLNNLVHLCRHHHRLVHEGGWTIRLLDDGRCEVRSPDGRPLVDAPAGVTPRGAGSYPATGPDPATGSDPTAGRDPGDPMALWPLSLGERYDLDLVVEAMVSWTRPPTWGCEENDHPLAA
jgi:hypothetical protein